MCTSTWKYESIESTCPALHPPALSAGFMPLKIKPTISSILGRYTLTSLRGAGHLPPQKVINRVCISKVVRTSNDLQHMEMDI